MYNSLHVRVALSVKGTSEILSFKPNDELACRGEGTRLRFRQFIQLARMCIYFRTTLAIHNIVDSYDLGGLTSVFEVSRNKRAFVRHFTRVYTLCNETRQKK